MRYIVLFVCLVGCSLPRKAEQQPIPKQPCDSVYKTDTLVEYDWIETEAPIQTEYMTDTIKVKYEKNVITTKQAIKKVEIIRYVQDASKVADLSNRLNRVSQDYKKAYLKAKNQEQYSKVLAVLLALLILALYFVAKKKR